MARTAANIPVGADTRPLERDIQSALNKDFKLKGLNEKAFTQPLGRITGAANEFQKSLDASNARVIAFGASAGAIFTVQKAFGDLIKSTIEVEKSLTDINVILNASSSTLVKFGNDLFDVAKITGQSFQLAASAATEFARQGLGVEETLKRTRDALILTRLSGLDINSSLEALTATINSFNKEALDSTTIINKLANVDAAFAVSSADLAEAIKRVGASAGDAGVNLDELLAIVTSVQQTTARGGAVIGNSLKTIFTRIQRTDTLNALEDLGIKVRDVEGNTLPAIQVLTNLSQTFDQLNDSQKAATGELVGGVFQINILKAALKDLGSEYSVYSNALNTSRNATDQAITRNEALNQTLSALINQTLVNFQQLGATIGKGAFQPAIQNVLGLINSGLEGINTADTESAGSKIGQGILKGISTFISGPGLALATAVIGKLFLDLGKFAATSTQALLGLGKQTAERVQLQTRISAILSQEPQLLAAIASKQVSVLAVEEKILGILRAQIAVREQAAAVASTVTTGLIGRGIGVKGGQITKTNSGGFIPNFANAALSEVYGALSGGYVPGQIKKTNIAGAGSVVYNSAETVKRFPGMSQPAIMPPQGSRAGKNYQSQFQSQLGFNPYASSGFIPNFAQISPSVQTSISKALANGDLRTLSNLETNAATAGKLTTADKVAIQEARASISASRGKKTAKTVIPYNATQLGLVGVQGTSGPLNATSSFATLGFPNDPRFVRFEGIQGRTLDDLRNSQLRNAKDFSTSINSLFAGPLTSLATKIFGPINPDPKFLNILQSEARGGVNLFPAGTEGSIFEAAVNLGTKKGSGALAKAFNQDTAQKPFDFEEAGSPSQAFNKNFGFSPYVMKADAKRTVGADQARDIIAKAYNANLAGLPQPLKAALGFIPNYSALSTAIGRETKSGIPLSKVRVGSNSSLVSSLNPMGLGVYNTRDEPRGLGQGIGRYKSINAARGAGASGGFIPNYANPSPISLQREMQINAQNQAETINKIKQTQKALDELRNTTEKTKLSVDRFGSAALGLSIGIPIILQTIGEFNRDNPKFQNITDSISTAISTTLAGAFVGAQIGTGGGPIGAAIGGTAGIGLGVFKFLQGLKEIDAATYTKELQRLQDEYNNNAAGLQKVIPLIQEYQRIQNSEAAPDIKQANLDLIQNQLAEALAPVGQLTADRIFTAIQNQNFDEVGQIIAKSLAEGAAATSNEALKVFFAQIKKTEITDKKKAGAIAQAATGLVSPTGGNYINELLKQQGGKEVVENVISNLEKLQKERNDLLKNQQQSIDNIAGQVPELRASLAQKPPTGTLQDLQERLSTIVAGASAEIKADPLAFFGVGKADSEKLSKLQRELNTNLSDILNAVAPIYQSSEEARTEFAEFVELSKDTNLSAETTDEVITKIIKRLRDAGANVQKIGDIVKNKGIQNADDFVRAFKNNTLTLETARKYFEETFNRTEFQALEILGREYDALARTVGKEILNRESRDTIMNTVTEQERVLKKKLDDRIITEDQYRIALDGMVRGQINLEKRMKGLIFSDQFQTGRQSERESRILSNQFKSTDIAQAFFDTFDYSKETLFRDVELGAIDSAKTIKSEFNNAFQSVIDGTANVGDAFQTMASNIAKRIQQVALELGSNVFFNSIFGSLGGLPDVFKSVTGGGKGGGGLFGFSRGGMVKGYSSGGSVVGGSGNKDDVPAMLSGGEYVIRKSAVQKYGTGMLGMLNGGRVKGFADGGGAFYNLANTYAYNNPNYPTGGEMQVDSRLSLMALLDPNNPQNALREKSEQNLINYLNYVQGVADQNAQESARISQLNKQIQDQYNSSKKQAFYGSLAAFGMTVAGGAISQYGGIGNILGLKGSVGSGGSSTFKGSSLGGSSGFGASYGVGSNGKAVIGKRFGGEVRGFASGGSSGKDDIPALLMGGEYVIRKDAVNTYGKKFFDDLNSGRVSKFAAGGMAGGNFGEAGSSFAGTNENNINITVNVSNQGTTQETASQTNNAEANAEEIRRKRELGELIKNQVIKTITDQQRPGGLLSSAKYKLNG
jgi:TP901 family phage tail tape measure protein